MQAFNSGKSTYIVGQNRSEIRYNSVKLSKKTQSGPFSETPRSTVKFQRQCFAEATKRSVAKYMHNVPAHVSCHVIKLAVQTTSVFVTVSSLIAVHFQVRTVKANFFPVRAISRNGLQH